MIKWYEKVIFGHKQVVGISKTNWASWRENRFLERHAVNRKVTNSGRRFKKSLKTLS
jgi:hypothetical protein